MGDTRFAPNSHRLSEASDPANGKLTFGICDSRLSSAIALETDNCLHKNGQKDRETAMNLWWSLLLSRNFGSGTILCRIRSIRCAGSISSVSRYFPPNEPALVTSAHREHEARRGTQGDGLSPFFMNQATLRSDVNCEQPKPPLLCKVDANLSSIGSDKRMYQGNLCRPWCCRLSW